MTIIEIEIELFKKHKYTSKDIKRIIDKGKANLLRKLILKRIKLNRGGKQK